MYCLNGDQTYRRRTAPKMSREVAVRAIDRCMERLSEGGQLQIVFFGGEPLLNWPLAEEIIAYVEDEIPRRHPGKRWHFHLTSNLAALPPDLTDTIRDHRISVLCDVDGPPDLHDSTRPFKGGRPSCARIAANVGRLVEAGIPVALRATITSRNVERMGEVARYHKAIGGSGTSAVPVNAVNSDEDFLGEDLLPDTDAFARGLRDTLDAGFDIGHVFPFNQFARTLRTDLHQTVGCGAALGNTPVVDVRGDVYACIYLVGMERYRTGNVLSDGVFPDWEVLDRMADQVRVDHIDQCRDCIYRAVCVGGCAVGTLLVADNPRAGPQVREYQREVRCKSIRVVVEETLWHMAGQADKALSRAGHGSSVAGRENGWRGCGNE